ncbi:hypothetical protein DUGA2_62750 [Duganella sp. HH101]|nr:hypothetical protein DUGA2_62750 [Duganella sp. HH101]
MRQLDGVACIIVAPERTSNSLSCCGLDAVSRPASTTRAPFANGRNSSSAAMSNDSDVTATSTSSLFMPGASPMLCRKLARLARLSATPFGFPVEPDV